jgi:hypothetical protein
MAGRVVAVIASPPHGPGPPSVDVWRGEGLALAMLEDVVDVVSDLEQVTAALVLVGAADGEAWRARVESLVWAGTTVLDARSPPGHCPRPDDGDAAGTASALMGALDALAGEGADTAAVVAADAPDLPGLLIGKLFRGVLRGDVAVCPAQGRGLVALAARLPTPAWLRGGGVGLDTPDAVDRLRAAAPRREALFVGPGWHRIRRPDDVAALDPGLEGWAATRAALAGTPR